MVINPNTLFSSSMSGIQATQLENLAQQLEYQDVAAALLTLIIFVGYFTNSKIWNKPDPFYHIWFERPQEAISDITIVQETRDIAQKLGETGKDLVIFWGSQSGTAESFANRLARECYRRFRLNAFVADLSEFDSDSIGRLPTTKLAIFILSTYGEGDPSDNASDFWEYLKTTTLDLKNLRYAAFGLGNSNYKYYNKVIDVVVKKLDDSNASCFLPVGRADDAGASGNEEDFLEWKEQLFNVFENKLGLKGCELEYKPSLKVLEDPSMDIVDLHLVEPVDQTVGRKANSQISAIVSVPVRQAKKLDSGPNTDRTCIHLDIDISSFAQLKYKTGDHVSIYPVNPEDEVLRLLKVLNLQPKKEIPLLISSLEGADQKIRLPSPTNLTALLTHYVDICAPVSRQTVQSLISFATTERSKALLQDVAFSKQSYSAFLRSHHLTFARLLEFVDICDPASTWSQLPLSFLLESLPPMKPRQYSISSSSVTSPRQLSITVAVSPTPLASNPSIAIPGLCSNYLSTFHSTFHSTSEPATAPNLFASIRRSTFKLPISLTTPILLVGTGTGIAPLRAFIHERAALARIGRSIGRILFFYGCRNAEHDYLYRNEIEELLDGPLKDTLEVVTAFSRPIKSGEQKFYVQNRILETDNAVKVERLLVEDDGAVFICGSTKMAKDAGDALLQAVGAKQGRGVADMLRWRDERRRMGRWKEDVWG